MKPIVALLAIALSQCAPAMAGVLNETRYCAVTPSRDADGSISRRADVVRAFRRIHPCPSTGLRSEGCAGWQLDHVIPLAVGGCDSVSNLQWLSNNLKTCAVTCKDRWEIRVYKR